MRVIVGLHHLELGGSQLNALDLATRMRDIGHDVHVFATHAGNAGPVADLVRDRDIPLTLIEHPDGGPRRGALFRRSVARALTRHAQRIRADLVHAYESDLILDAFYGPCLSLGTGLVGTVYGMAVPTWLPRSATLIVGTRELVAGAQAVGQRATLLEPPVDTTRDHPDAADGNAFRRSLGIRNDEIALVVVSRLEPDMKEEGIARAMAAVAEHDHPGLRLLVVGSGPSWAALAARAASVNAAFGRDAVVMTGALVDPRPAYAAADIALGMGGSALRAMAFATPVVVLGKDGFSRPFNPATSDYFFEKGFYGIGSTDPDQLAAQIDALLDQSLRSGLGAWSRRIVVERYSLDAAAHVLEGLYEDVVTGPAVGSFKAAVRTAVHRPAAEFAGPAVRARLRPVIRRVLARGAIH